jgi:hypothetical protein
MRNNPRRWAWLIIGWCLAACGGSSSETPFPQDASELTMLPSQRENRPASSGLPEFEPLPMPATSGAGLGATGEPPPANSADPVNSSPY